MLLVRSAPEDARPGENTAPHAAQPQVTVSEPVAPVTTRQNKAAAGSEAASPSSERAAVPASSGVGVIRPVTDSWKQAVPDSPDDDAEAFLTEAESEESRPTAAEARAPKAKKKASVAAPPARRTVPPAPLRRAPPPASVANEGGPPAPTSVAPKKSSTLDLFNDTK
jgi:hypothetical protein